MRSLLAGFPLDDERLDGFKQGLAEANLSIDDVPILETIPGEPSAGAVVFDRAPEATAILTMSDWQAITILDEAVRRGIGVPGHVSVVGFDGTAESARTTPPMTTVAQDVIGKGRLAARMVIDNEAPPPGRSAGRTGGSSLHSRAEGKNPLKRADAPSASGAALAASFR
ncbi:substrate-binding domain-containing protein [Mesorhizobium sp. M0767]|uniref:substrate-binding domain-containing protein n=1 Tax=Mesorhizobium sp. M0767 TaxID=2956995 RepID=UPI003339FA55